MAQVRRGPFTPRFYPKVDWIPPYYLWYWTCDDCGVGSHYGDRHRPGTAPSASRGVAVRGAREHDEQSHNVRT